MGFTFVHQILRLGRGEKLDELLDQLNPMPGHRVRLLNFAEEERARAQLNRIAPVRPPSASVLTAISQQPALTQSEYYARTVTAAEAYRASACAPGYSGGADAAPRAAEAAQRQQALAQAYSSYYSGLPNLPSSP